MKRNFLVLAVMVAAVLFLTPHNTGAQYSCYPYDQNPSGCCGADSGSGGYSYDLGICDTLYVETFDCDSSYEAELGSFDSVRVAIYVTHDSNTFWWPGGGIWVQDSIAWFTIPLTFWHQPPGCADSVILPTWDNWNNKCIDPDHPDSMNRSMFRHIVDTHTDDTTYNRMLQMVENGNDAWNVYTSIESHSSDGDSGHVFLALASTNPNCQRWWEGERVLLATLTFHVYMSDTCHTTEIGIDSTFWPPESRLAFTRHDAKLYIPRHFLPVKDTIYQPFEPDTCTEGIPQGGSVSHPASGLEVGYTGTGGTLRDVVLTKNPYGCPTPDIQVTGGNTVRMDWGEPCVDYLETVEYEFIVDYPCEVVHRINATWIFCEAPLETLAYYGPPKYVFTIPDAYGDDFFNERFIMPDAYSGRLDQIHICFYQPSSPGTPVPIIYVWSSDSLYPDDNDPPLGAIAEFYIDNWNIVWYPNWTVVQTREQGLEFGPGETFHIGYSHDKEDGDTLAIVSDNADGTGVEQSSEWWLGQWGTMLDDWGTDYDFFIRAVICPYRPYMCGDCNNDSAVNVADVVNLINYLFNEFSSPDPLCVGDANCDGKVEVVDVVYLINYLFGELSPPCLECCDESKMEELPGQETEKVYPQKEIVPRKLPKAPGGLKRME